MQRNTDGQPGMETHYYLHDDLFNVIGLADDTGTLQERYEYGDYGMPAVYDASNGPLAESAFQNAYLFNGRRFDSDTGLYYYRTRYMNPELGRFISRDTIGLWGDANNLGNPYTYLGNNPWSGLDPFGEQEFHQSFGETSGAVTGFIGDLHETAVAGPIRTFHPNPGPKMAAVYSEIFMVDPYGDLDLYTHGNNNQYTGVQLILVVSPTKVFKILKGAKTAVVGAVRTARGTRTAVMMVDSAGEGANLARKLSGASDEVFVTLNKGGDVIGDVSRISKPKHAPVIDKWVKKGGKIRQHPDGTVEYIDWDGNKVLYRDGYPDFEASGHVRQTVYLDDMKGKASDMIDADKLAKKQRLEGNVWHHHEDLTRMQEVPFAINNRFSHKGGSAFARERAARLKAIILGEQ